ncbi:MliC family protein (plasmid) [Rhizobium sp. T1470]|uniref:MliC family protein n=1 Tax=unclassified Rhizobium TaxID=2613769 RepID=UPI0030CFD702|nr:MliC family protein [Rhizobium sp. T1473]
MMTAKTTMMFALAALAISAAKALSTEAQYECATGTRLHAAFHRMTLRPAVSCSPFWGASGEIRLPQLASADGGRYANNDMEFWIQGNEATLTVGGKSETCHTN